MTRGFSLSFAFALVGVLTLALVFDALVLVASILLACVVGCTMWRAPRLWGFAALMSAPMIGWMLSFTLPRSAFTERVFAGSIDLPLADVVAALALVGVAVAVTRADLWKWWAHRLPFVWSYAGLVVAHLLSVFSATNPDPYAIIKFALRPVAFSYAAFVAMPQALLRTWRDVRIAFGLFIGGASLFALQGLVSLVVGERLAIGTLHRARPLPIMGVYPIGTNHNVLAEWLVVAAPFALALASWTHDRVLRRCLYVVSGLCVLVAALTFARSAWIVLALEVVALCATVWKVYLAQLWRVFTRGLWVVVTPLAGYMVWFSTRQEVASSTDARAMLGGIAWKWFTIYPLFGVGAGRFVEYVAATKSYQLLFGGPMDAHGVFQKLLAETGIVGVAAYVLLSLVIARLVVLFVKRAGSEHRIGIGLTYAAVGVLGAWTYQIFNTTYWSAKLWLPIGLFFAAAHLYRSRRYD